MGLAWWGYLGLHAPQTNIQTHQHKHTHTHTHQSININSQNTSTTVWEIAYIVSYPYTHTHTLKCTKSPETTYTQESNSLWSFALTNTPTHTHLSHTHSHTFYGTLTHPPHTGTQSEKCLIDFYATLVNELISIRRSHSGKERWCLTLTSVLFLRQSSRTRLFVCPYVRHNSIISKRMMDNRRSGLNFIKLLRAKLTVVSQTFL